MRKAYKLFRLRRDGTLGPLFINARLRVPVGQWLPAEPHRTRGFAFRPGWHCTSRPFAPHLSPRGRVWAEVTIDDFRDHHRPASQGGLWFTANRLRVNRLLTKSEVRDCNRRGRAYSRDTTKEQDQ